MKKKVEIVLNRVESALMLTAFPNRTRTNWVEKNSDGAFLLLLDTIKSYISTSLDQKRVLGFTDCLPMGTLMSIYCDL